MGELKARLDTDIIDQHNYFSYVRIPVIYGEWNELIPQVKSPFYNSITYASLLDTKGYPLTQSESNHNNPTLYSSEFPLFLSVYGSFHDWDQWTFFKTHGTNYSDPKRRFYEPFDDWYSPERMAFMPAASKIFRNRYIEPGTNVIELNHTNETVYNYQFDRANRQFSVPGLYTDLVMERRITRNDFEASVDKTKEDYYSLYDVQEPGNPYVTSNNQLYLDSERGYLLINAPKAQGFSGFSQASIVHGDYLDVYVPPKGNNFSTMIMIPLDDKDISNSEHLFLTASGRSENNITQWAADKRGFSHDKKYHYYSSPGQHFGQPPAFVEGITAEISLVTSATDATINILNSNGQRTDRTVPFEINNGRLYFDISDMDETLWYEIVLSGSPGTINPPGGGNNNDNLLDSCGNDVCDIDEDCEICQVDCGPCIPNPRLNSTNINIVYIDYSIDTYLETLGGQYDLVIENQHYIVSIYAITNYDLKFLYDGEVYTINLGDFQIVNINGYPLKINYFKYNDLNAKLIFSLEQENVLTTYAYEEFLYFVLFGLFYLLFFLLVMFLRRKPIIKENHNINNHLEHH